MAGTRPASQSSNQQKGTMMKSFRSMITVACAALVFSGMVFTKNVYASTTGSVTGLLGGPLGLVTGEVGGLLSVVNGEVGSLLGVVNGTLKVVPAELGALLPVVNYTVGSTAYSLAHLDNTLLNTVGGTVHSLVPALVNGAVVPLVGDVGAVAGLVGGVVGDVGKVVNGTVGSLSSTVSGATGTLATTAGTVVHSASGDIRKAFSANVATSLSAHHLAGFHARMHNRIRL